MYSDQTRIEAHLQRELTEHEILAVDDIIRTVSADIDAFTGRSWLSVQESDEGEDVAEERSFDGNGCREIFVDDFIGLEKVELQDFNGDTIETIESDSDWQVSPNNKNPKNAIRLRSAYFPEGYGNVLITAIWGSGTAPVDVIQVCTELSAKYISRMGTTGQYKSESIEGYSRTLLDSSETANDTAEALNRLDHHKKRTL